MPNAVRDDPIRMDKGMRFGFFITYLRYRTAMIACSYKIPGFPRGHVQPDGVSSWARVFLTAANALVQATEAFDRLHNNIIDATGSALKPVNI